MSSNSTTRKPTFKVTRPSSLRKVGSEATKPKPGPAKPAKVTSPTYEQQDAEGGTQDTAPQADAIVEEEEESDVADEEVEHHAPAPVKSGPTRSKSSKFPVPAPRPRPAQAAAPHLSLLSLVYDHKPIPGKPAKTTEFLPSFFRLFAMHSAVSAILCPVKAIHKDNPVYNTIFSRLALSFCAVYIILSAREVSNLITYEESKVLKKLRNTLDFDKVMIPGPYLAFLSTFGFHSPADNRFDAIVPRLPFIDANNDQDVTKTIIYDHTDKGYCLFPHFPSLMFLAHLIASGKTSETYKEDGHVAATDPDYPRYWQGRHFVFANLDKDYAVATVRWGKNVKSVANRKANYKFLMYNCALYYPFQDKPSDLEKVCDALTIDKIPYAPFTIASAPDLLTYFGIKGQARWLSSVFESLEYEAKFFKGSAPLGSIGIETGQNILCISRYQLGTTELESSWFEEYDVAEDGHTVRTGMENVSDGDMAIANLTSTIVEYTGGHANNYLVGTSSVSLPTNIPADRFDPYKSNVRRVIKDVPLLAHRFQLHLRTEMLLKFDDVISV